MIKNSLCLILILLIEVFSVSVMAANEFQRPTIYPPTSLSVKKCQIVRIVSLIQNASGTYAQTGLGWAFSGDEGFKILTAAHVVAGADTLAIECQGKYFTARIQGKTETKDLALLIPDPQIAPLLFPLVELKRSSSVKAKAVDHFKESFDPLRF